METEKYELKRRLKSRHIMMIALGGTIGAGMFKGSSTSISLAGPGVILDYLIGGLILLFVMQGLAGMAIRNPDVPTFRDLIRIHLGSFSGYVAGWIIGWIGCWLWLRKPPQRQCFCSIGFRQCLYGCFPCLFQSQ